MGPGQQHRILRQVVELAGCRHDDAAALQAAAARLCQRDWLPVIDRVCSTLGDGQRVLRIDRLQVDLGTLPATAWLSAAPGVHMADRPDPADAGAATAALVQRFEQAFSAGLEAALKSAAEVQTDAELLATFLSTGVLPWWADAGDRQGVVRAVTAQLRQRGSAWRQWLGRDGGSAPNDVALRRLVTSLPDALLAELLAQRLADAAPDPADAWTPALHTTWQAVLDQAAVALGQPLQRWRRAWWQSSLTVALWPEGGGTGWAALLPAWLAMLGQPAAPVRQALRQALDGAATTPAEAPAWAPLWRALQPPDGAAASRAAQADEAWQWVLAALARLAAGQGTDAAIWRHLNARLSQGPGPGAAPASRLANALGQRLAETWEHAAGSAAGAQQGGRAVATAAEATDLAAALSAVLHSALQQGLIDPALAGLDGPAGGPALLRQRAAAWAAAVGATSPSPGAAPLSAVLPSARPSSAAKTAAPTPTVDALYVPNAGLVLLWPFVQRFAERLDLLQPGKPVRWRDAAAAQRAAVLLHCVISGDAEPPEFQLALPKLLCGLPLDDTLALDEPLSEAEQAECTSLLVAAIAQAPILRQMSVAGFRGSFGLREGQLSARDGHWLLRVERQAYDVVIDRFPWSANLVRLPWMPALLQVQW